ncbi:MAG: phosphatase PAP2 family protein [Chloroflexota bacterium]|nr:phosphatase PAP2 family protein [Chloroflexota bacterium]MDH5242771.1 phosphatase PAP2 family protein [Chloroflexota bacterium]
MTAPSEAPEPAIRSAPDPARRFVVAAIGYFAALVAVYLLFVSTEMGQRLENSALRAATLREESTRIDSLTYLSQVSVASFVGAMAVIALVGLLRRRPGLGALAVAVMAGSVLAAEILKVGLPRPALVDGPIWILRNSFPSGTATVAASVGIGALLVAPDRLRWLILVAAAAIAAIIGQATQVTGWHRASDVLGGVILSALVGCIGLLVLVGIRHVQPSHQGRVHPRILAAIWIVAAGAILLGMVLLGALILFPLLRAPEGAESVFLHTASDLIAVGLSTMTMATFALVIEPYTLGAAAARTVPTQPGAPLLEEMASDESPGADPADPAIPDATPADRAGDGEQAPI